MAVTFKRSILVPVYGIMMLNHAAMSYLSELSMSAGLKYTDNVLRESKMTLFHISEYGMAEPLRLILAYSEKDFIDKHISAEEWDQEFRETMPFGQVPVLKLDLPNGDPIYMNQSKAICRWLAKPTDLDGDESRWTYLLIDIIVGTLEDFLQDVKQYYCEQDTKLKNEFLSTLKTEKIPFIVNKFEEIAKLNNFHLVQEKLTWADIYTAAMFRYVSLILDFNVIGENTNLKQLIENVYDQENIKMWTAKRKPSNVKFPNAEQLCSSVT